MDPQPATPPRSDEARFESRPIDVTTEQTTPGHQRSTRMADSVTLSRTILHSANRGLFRIDFLRETTTELLEFSGTDAIEVRLSDGIVHYRWNLAVWPEPREQYEIVQWTRNEEGMLVPARDDHAPIEQLCRCVACRHYNTELPCFTKNGSFHTGDATRPVHVCERCEIGRNRQHLQLHDQYRSIAIIRFLVDRETIGLLLLKSRRFGFFREEDVEFYETVAQTYGLAVKDRRAEVSRRERVKELTCLYQIVRIGDEPGLTVSETLQRVVELLPPAWYYTQDTEARIVLDGETFATAGYRKTPFVQSAEIVVGGALRGRVEVVYLEDKPELASGALYAEKKQLIDGIARELALIIEQKEADSERASLQDQLIHADRLATIGQLAAGVAHELNEPLGSVLGFAQLVQKCEGLPHQADRDLQKIVSAALYAREVIKKLLVFARQMPPQVHPVNLNRVIEESMYFLEGRCARGSIRVERDLAALLPDIEADASQLSQVVVNLVVNAIQAMDEGGTLTLSTLVQGDFVLLVVGDTGHGMPKDVRDKIFLPFFSTKDVDEGTGLGLAVVHGIVNGHNGSINVESRPGHGSRFEVRLPIHDQSSGSETMDDG